MTMREKSIISCFPWAAEQSPCRRASCARACVCLGLRSAVDATD